LEGVFAFEEAASALDGEEGGNFRFRGMQFPGGEIAVWKVRKVA
jgi:hypothetical protein